MTPEQERFEKNAIMMMIGALKAVRDEGYADWQTLTSFLANMMLDQDNPPKMLRQLYDDTKMKINMMRDLRRKESH